jgi:hypothetical protein
LEPSRRIRYLDLVKRPGDPWPKRAVTVAVLQGFSLEEGDNLVFQPDPRLRIWYSGLCLLRTSSTAQSVTFPRSGSSWPTPMLHLLYALLATARSSLKPQRELTLQNVALRASESRPLAHPHDHRGSHLATDNVLRNDRFGRPCSDGRERYSPLWPAACRKPPCYRSFSATGSLLFSR